jgi:hypothetical protein
MRSLQNNLPLGAAPTKGTRQTKNGVKPKPTGQKAATAANKPARGRKKSPKPRNSKKRKQLVFSKMDENIISLFGFISDPLKTRRPNLCKLVLHSTPTSLLAARPQTLRLP